LWTCRETNQSYIKCKSDKRDGEKERETGRKKERETGRKKEREKER
jgi:hypothetical protein